MHKTLPNMVTVGCAWCKKTGRAHGVACTVCLGAGHLIVVPDEEGHPVPCALCGGSGRNSNQKCEACQGSGWAARFSSAV